MALGAFGRRGARLSEGFRCMFLLPRDIAMQSCYAASTCETLWLYQQHSFSALMPCAKFCASFFEAHSFRDTHRCL